MGNLYDFLTCMTQFYLSTCKSPQYKKVGVKWVDKGKNATLKINSCNSEHYPFVSAKGFPFSLLTVTLFFLLSKDLKNESKII